DVEVFPSREEVSGHEAPPVARWRHAIISEDDPRRLRHRHRRRHRGDRDGDAMESVVPDHRRADLRAADHECRAAVPPAGGAAVIFPSGTSLAWGVAIGYAVLFVERRLARR